MGYNPEFMVIGDSLAQGCRSLSVSERLCKASWGAMVAQSQNWAFTTPNHPRPVLFDLESIVRRVSPVLPATLAFGLIELKKIFKNMKDWETDLSSGDALSAHATFENLGVAGAMTQELCSMTSSEAKAQALEILGRIESSPFEILDHLEDVGRLHRMINYAFVLNPTQEAEYETRTPMDWVRGRKPKRLGIQIGHNHGLFSAGEFGEVRDLKISDLTGLDELVQELAALPAEIEEIYWCTLPKLSAVSNLVPEDEPTEGYADEYRPVMAVQEASINRSQMMKLDRQICAINAEVKQKLRGAFDAKGIGTGRLRFIDIYELFSRLDYKNSLDNSTQVVVPQKGNAPKLVFNNRKLRGVSKKKGRPGSRSRSSKRGFRRTDGGLLSIDGMHPSAVGYALVANEVVERMGRTCNLISMIREANKKDTLLSRYPSGLFWFYAALEFAQALSGSEETPVIEEDQVSIDDVVKLCTSVTKGHVKEGRNS